MNNKNRRIVIASDGSGFEVKEAVKSHVLEEGYSLTDLTIEPADYYSAGYEAGSYVSEGKADLSVVLCGNGYGIGHTAALFDNVFVVNCANVSQARSGRAVNDANILAMGGNIVSKHVAIEIVDAFLTTNFGDGLPQKDIDYLKGSFEEVKNLKK